MSINMERPESRLYKKSRPLENSDRVQSPTFEPFKTSTWYSPDFTEENLLSSTLSLECYHNCGKCNNNITIFLISLLYRLETRVLNVWLAGLRGEESPGPRQELSRGNFSTDILAARIIGVRQSPGLSCAECPRTILLREKQK